MAPQYTKHNNKIWSDWEKYVREKAEEFGGKLFVITGVAGEENPALVNLHVLL